MFLSANWSVSLKVSNVCTEGFIFICLLFQCSGGLSWCFCLYLWCWWLVPPLSFSVWLEVYWLYWCSKRISLLKVTLIFSVFYFIDFCSNCITYFLLLTLNLIYSSFSGFLRWKLKLPILLYLSHMWHNTINFPLGTFYLHLIYFYLAFLILLTLKYVKAPPGISSLTHVLFGAYCLFSPQVSWDYPSSFHY